jgi:antitoxin component of RelBE/YafQ-DinJ toxin-antitoxin module
MADKKTPTKKGQLLIRMDEGLKTTFQNVCKNNDDDASKVIRRFMREYIRENKQGGLL